MDNRNISLGQLSILREKAVNAVIKKQLTQKEASKVFGFSSTSMTKYMAEYRAIGKDSFCYKKPGSKEGNKTKIPLEEMQKLAQLLTSKTPDELGLPYTLWNSKVVAYYIYETYGIQYHDRSIRKIMTKLGFTSQKPIKLAYQRDPKKIEEWLSTTYPAIKVRASQEGARIYWGDEMGIQSTDNRGSTYGLKGITPMIKKTGSRFKCNMLAAISPQGFMNWTVFEDNFTAETFVHFLGRLIKQTKQKVFLIVDNHKVHHAKRVLNYVNERKDKIELFYLPPYCPEMNPQELVNQDVKAHCNNFKTLRNIEHLTINVRYYLSKIQFDEFKIMSFFKKDEVKYAAWNHNYLVPG